MEMPKEEFRDVFSWFFPLNKVSDDQMLSVGGDRCQGHHPRASRRGGGALLRHLGTAASTGNGQVAHQGLAGCEQRRGRKFQPAAGLKAAAFLKNLLL